MRDESGKIVPPLTPDEKAYLRRELDKAGRKRGAYHDELDREELEVDRAIKRHARDIAYRRDRQRRLRAERKAARDNAE